MERAWDLIQRILRRNRVRSILSPIPYRNQAGVRLVSGVITRLPEIETTIANTDSVETRSFEFGKPNLFADSAMILDRI